jgi:hypothetical protein
MYVTAAAYAWIFFISVRALIHNVDRGRWGWVVAVAVVIVVLVYVLHDTWRKPPRPWADTLSPPLYVGLSFTIVLALTLGGFAAVGGLSVLTASFAAVSAVGITGTLMLVYPPER